MNSPDKPPLFILERLTPFWLAVAAAAAVGVPLALCLWLAGTS